MAKKSNIRSIRFSDEVLKIIEAQPGDTFTAKFEGLIFRCEQELPGKEQELKYMQMRIDSEHQRLKRIQKSAAELEQSIRNLKYAVDSCNAQAKRAVSNLENIINDV